MEILLYCIFLVDHISGDVQAEIVNPFSLSENLHHPDFAGSEKTTDLIRRLDQLVDCLKS